MKPLLRSCVSLLFVSILLMTVPTGFARSAPLEPEEWTRYSLIAHGMGGLDGVEVTNSLEAFETNYAKGQRVFEVDFTITTDGQLAARHDWLSYLDDKFEQDVPAEKRDQPLSMEDFKSYKILQKYTPISFEDVAHLLKQHPDVYIITDTKELDPELIAKQFTIIRDTAAAVDPAILDRLVPEIYSPEMMDIVKGIIPFKHVIFSIYMSEMDESEVVDYVKTHDIGVVAMPFERANATFMRTLKKQGAVVYVHTLNTVEDVQKYMDMGVHGVYTDFLTYADLGLETPAPAMSEPAVAGAATVLPKQLPVMQLSASTTLQAAEKAAPVQTKQEESGGKHGFWAAVKAFVSKLF